MLQLHQDDPSSSRAGSRAPSIAGGAAKSTQKGYSSADENGVPSVVGVTTGGTKTSSIAGGSGVASGDGAKASSTASTVSTGPDKRRRLASPPSSLPIGKKLRRSAKSQRKPQSMVGFTRDCLRTYCKIGEVYLLRLRGVGLDTTDGSGTAGSTTNTKQRAEAESRAALALWSAFDIWQRIHDGIGPSAEQVRSIQVQEKKL